MAILAMATSRADLWERLGRIEVARTPGGASVSAEDLGAAGAMAAVLRDAVRPNLVQTLEVSPSSSTPAPSATSPRATAPSWPTGWP